MAATSSFGLAGNNSGYVPEVAALTRLQRRHDRSSLRLDPLGVLEREPVAQARDDRRDAEPAFAVRHDSVRPVADLAAAQARLADDLRPDGEAGARATVGVDDPSGDDAPGLEPDLHGSLRFPGDVDEAGEPLPLMLKAQGPGPLRHDDRCQGVPAPRP